MAARQTHATIILTHRLVWMSGLLGLDTRAIVVLAFLLMWSCSIPFVKILTDALTTLVAMADVSTCLPHVMVIFATATLVGKITTVRAHG